MITRQYVVRHDYEKRGYLPWVVFDTETKEVIGRFLTREEAEEHCKKLNGE